MVKQVWEYIEQHKMIAKRDRVLVACSGGADSIALLLLLWEEHKARGFEVEALHVEHGIRGEESLQDANFVREFCLERNIPYTCVRVDAPAYASEKHLGLEEAARILRYEALRKRADAILEIEAMLDGGANDCASAKNRRVTIALAHHAEDNAETILFQMVRGSGLDGVCGMAPVRQEKGYTYIRPLLGATREEIEGYLATLGQNYCIDSTNEDVNYSRNYVRKEVLPGLTKLNDQAVSHINQMAEQLTLVSDYVQSQVDHAYSQLVRQTPKGLRIGTEDVLALHPMLRRELLMELMANCCGSRKDLANVHVLALEDLLTKQSGKKLDLPYGMQAVIRYEDLCLDYGSEQKPCSEDATDGFFVSKEMLSLFLEDGELHEIMLPGTGISLSLQVLTGLDFKEEIQKKTYTKTFDYDKIKDGFFARKRRDLDYLVIDALGHRKTLSTFCIDQKIPAECRDDLVVLAADSEVIWVLGERISENYKLTPATKVFVRVSYDGGK